MKHFFIFTTFLCFLAFNFSAAQFSSSKTKAIFIYVDSQNGNDNNSGKTTAQPWKTISKVNSTNFRPGTQILFKRGSVFYETLVPSSSGTSNSPIIFGAYGSLNLPAPVIDGGSIRNNGIYHYGKNNVIIRDLRFQNCIGNGAIRIMYSTNVRVENCSFLVTGHGGVFIENSNNCLITGNTITTPTGDLAKQTDGIYSQRNSDNTYEKNTIILTNSNATAHIDGIQSYIDNNLTLRDNFIHQDNPKTNAQGIYATTGSGVHTYFNNVVYCPNVVASTMGFKNLDLGTGTLRAYHNTLIGRGANILAINGDPNAIVKNNIFVALSPTHGIIRVDNECNNPSNIDNNLYHNGGSSIAVTYKGVNISFAQWKSQGFETNGLFANPQLEPNYKLKPGSPAINKGNEIGSLCEHDKAGTVRPQMGIVDIGAYESFYSAKETEENGIPSTFDLSQNYPNPFNPTTTIRYSIPEASFITLKVFDILGNEVTTLVQGHKAEGSFEVEFSGEGLASGTYIYQLKGDNFLLNRKMSLLK